MSEKSTHPAYRADIDGLRAIAIAMVVAYHAFPYMVKGGFIGVDVFFVISGYLISTILFTDITTGRFSFVDFYSRRIRRIFPALLLVLLACLAYGWHCLLFQEYAQLGKHAAGGAGFVSNLILQSESSYFDNSSTTKPLVHLWSLGIEEQFYIVWPLLLWLFWKGRASLLKLTLVLTAASFSWSIFNKQAANELLNVYYSPFARIWELLSGSLLAWYNLFPDKIHVPDNNRWRHLSSTLGLACLAAGLVLITRAVSFPGWWALLPVLGAVLLISAGKEVWFNRFILSHPLLVRLGLISYPLYLWHWPLLSFYEITHNEPPSAKAAAIIILLSLLLASTTYWLIERPIRFGGNAQQNTLSLFMLMGMIGLAGFGIYKSNGVQWRSFGRDGDMLAYYDYYKGVTEKDFWEGSCFSLYYPYTDYAKNGCEKIKFPGAPKIFLIGDSHSAYLSPGLRAYADAHKVNLIQYSAAFCTPLSLLDERKRCEDINRYVQDKIASEKPDTVIMFANYAAYWNAPTDATKINYDRFVVQKMVDFKRLGVKNMLLIGQMPTWDDTLPKSLFRRFVYQQRPIPIRTYEGVQKGSLEWDSAMHKLATMLNIHYISLRDFLCNTEGCITMDAKNPLPGQQVEFIVLDYGHLTAGGAKFITENVIAPYLPQH